MKKLAGLFLSILLLTLACPAQTQEVLYFTFGILTRPGSSHVQPTQGYLFHFRFDGPNLTEVGGIVLTSRLNITETDDNCCFYGKRLVISDFTLGTDNFYQGTELVRIDGVTYPAFYYQGIIRFNGSVLVPFHLKKKAQATIRVPITVTGYLQGSPIVPRTEMDPLMSVVLNNLKGFAVYTIRRHDVAGMENHFDIVSVTYELTSSPPFI
jgi:hypothetical protein